MSYKSVLRNEQSCMKIHGFQGKWPMLWQHSWHSLFKWSLIVHKGAYWNDKQCCLRMFSLSLHKKFKKCSLNSKNVPHILRDKQCCLRNPFWRDKMKKGKKWKLLVIIIGVTEFIISYNLYSYYYCGNYIIVELRNIFI